jgi:hypothetical protein
LATHPKRLLFAACASKQQFIIILPSLLCLHICPGYCVQFHDLFLENRPFASRQASYEKKRNTDGSTALYHIGIYVGYLDKDIKQPPTNN